MRSGLLIVILIPRQGRFGIARGHHEEAKDEVSTREGRAEAWREQSRATALQLVDTALPHISHTWGLPSDKTQ